MHIARRIQTRGLLAVLTAILTVGLTPAPLLTAQTPRTATAVLQDLHRVDELKEMFNRDVGKVRLVLLLSPT